VPVKRVAFLPEILNENSGISISADEAWLLNDSGNEVCLYKINKQGKIIRTLKIGLAQNRDWEELCADTAGNLYIADIGNNHNKRGDLCIYKIANPDKHNKDSVIAERIGFFYPEQEHFPPSTNQLYYDAEAMIALGDSLYIFTKNRTRPNDGYVFCYALPQSPGDGIAARKCGTYRLRQRGFLWSITGAAISPDNKTLLLLSMTKLHRFRNFEDANFFSAKNIKHYSLPFSQKEAIGFIDNKIFLLSDEKSRLGKAKLYRSRLR